ncbi:MAG: hypothetical protein WBD95_14615, partial [Xanthobacteraceae bacterium]
MERNVACGHTSSVRESSGWPPLKPLLRQAFVAVAAQSGAPFAAVAQRSRTSTTRVFGSRPIAVAA